MIKISCLTEKTTERIINTFGKHPALKFLYECNDVTEKHYNTTEQRLYDLEIDDFAIVKLYNPDSSIVIDLGGKTEILERNEFRELRFC